MSQHCNFIYKFPKKDLENLKLKMLNWLRPFNIFAYLDNNDYHHRPNRFECLIGAGAVQTFHNPENLPEGKWLFGHLNYEFGQRFFTKVGWRKTPSQNTFPNCFFFLPETIISIPFGKSELHISTIDPDPENILKSILACSADLQQASETIVHSWQTDFSEQEYVTQIQNIKQDIRRGDYYELNFCVQSHACYDYDRCQPFDLFAKINRQNPSPFAAFYRQDNHFLLSASPERFLHKEKRQLRAQPIKGTIKRGRSATEDEQLKNQLISDIKERAENLMITDLTRNDLAKICTVGSVHVPDLLGLYTFPTLHHIISTVEGSLKADSTFKDILEAAFPMGSMTGAPKKIVLERIDQYEKNPRGIYSGSVGYIMPDGDFDFNVVIRSLVLNTDTRQIRYATGGAITYDSIPEKEWQETVLKAKSMKEVFH
ncbi:MAG TPA: anthranilate synthase component I family protein [Edaphocola sp.]|nr:anthranilate synthase component I family protein [Edaphocola sp.]